MGPCRPRTLKSHLAGGLGTQPLGSSFYATPPTVRPGLGLLAAGQNLFSVLVHSGVGLGWDLGNQELDFCP